MSLESEFKEIASQESGSNYISAPGVYPVEITACDLSEDVNKENKGTPYLEISFKTDEGASNKTRLYRVKDGDSDKSKEFKQGKIKELFSNAGIDMKESGKKSLVEIIGKSVKALFRTEEYIGYDGDNNNQPIIKESIKYLYCGPIDQKLQGKTSYFQKPLDDTEKAKYDAELKKWNRDNEESAPVDTKAKAETKADTKEDSLVDDTSDDLPF